MEALARRGESTPGLETSGYDVPSRPTSATRDFCGRTWLERASVPRVNIGRRAQHPRTRANQVLKCMLRGTVAPSPVQQQSRASKYPVSFAYDDGAPVTDVRSPEKRGPVSHPVVDEAVMASTTRFSTSRGVV